MPLLLHLTTTASAYYCHYYLPTYLPTFTSLPPFRAPHPPCRLRFKALGRASTAQRPALMNKMIHPSLPPFLSIFSSWGEGKGTEWATLHFPFPPVDTPLVAPSSRPRPATAPRLASPLENKVQKPPCNNVCFNAPVKTRRAFAPVQIRLSRQGNKTDIPQSFVAFFFFTFSSSFLYDVHFSIMARAG